MPTSKKAIRSAPPVASDAVEFYTAFLRLLKETKLPFMVGGTYAVNAYVGLNRPTKDIDVFCRTGDFPRILAASTEAGFVSEIEDERWIAKVRQGAHYADVIFGSANSVTPVTDAWFAESSEAKVLGVSVALLPPTELIWSKGFIADRHKFDGNDIVHIILTHHEKIDWKRLLSYFEQHWEVLLVHVLRFRYVYPSEREIIPRWLLDELLRRLTDQITLPTSKRKTCRGRLFSKDDFLIDITEFGFADLLGDDRGAMEERQAELAKANPAAPTQKGSAGGPGGAAGVTRNGKHTG